MLFVLVTLEKVLVDLGHFVDRKSNNSLPFLLHSFDKGVSWFAIWVAWAIRWVALRATLRFQTLRRLHFFLIGLKGLLSLAFICGTILVRRFVFFGKDEGSANRTVSNALKGFTHLGICLLFVTSVARFKLDFFCDFYQLWNFIFPLIFVAGINSFLLARIFINLIEL